MANRLAGASSPYLLQHADNPVDWYEWGPEALAEAARTDRPILLSIGYAACHWCHVMAHESFEDAGTARVMNAHFVNIKVDREERPDLDSIYMQAVQAITGHGGWPMTMFLTPDGIPFYGGTYFPPEDRHGMPSFQRVLVSVSEAWKHRRDEVMKGATSLCGIYAAAEGPTIGDRALSASRLDDTLRAMRSWFDQEHGGFGGAPKFPQTQVLDALLRFHRRTGDAESLAHVRFSVEQMVAGGIHDQIGGGFHRYTVDGAWQVPHFEKMLYDNALLVRLAVDLWQVTQDPAHRAVAEATVRWLAREMTDPLGGWYASLDADSEGQEGRFYVWSLAEFRAVAGDDAAVAEAHWGLTAGGNFEGANIPHVARSLAAVADSLGIAEDEAEVRLERARAALYTHRAHRVWPGRDEKVLAGWNGLMLRAVADGARLLGDDAWRALAVANGTFLRDQMVRDGRVFRSWRNGHASIPGFLEDHAAVALGFLALYDLTGEAPWLAEALRLAETTVRYFWDAEAQAFFDTAHDAERLVTRPRDVTDNAIPSGTSQAIELQTEVARRTGDPTAHHRAHYALSTLAMPMQKSPLAFGHLLGVAERFIHGAPAGAICGPDGCVLPVRT
ncbi:MAG: thioredoxin domain-containing protein [Gemmatimonadaceae bacterium]